MAPQTAAPSSLEVRRVIRAPRKRVFEAWTKPEELKRWHAPGPLTVSLAELDVRTGGSYRIHMREPDGREHRVSGVYRLVDPPKRLVYTWAWEGEHPVKDSVVTIDFIERGDTTEVVLRHEGFPAGDERDNHEKGWTAILDKLEAEFSGRK
jgi:glutathione S-transferase